MHTMEKYNKLNSILVCNLSTEPTTFVDNKTGKCYMCKRSVYFRPHAPDLNKVCTECFLKLPLNEDNSEMVVTKESMEELIKLWSD